MAEAYRRHDLVRVDAAAWSATLDARTDLHAVPHLRGWAAAGRPLIVRRRLPGEGADLVPLGLALAPADGKRRIGLALPATALTLLDPPSLADVAGHAPSDWQRTIAALIGLGQAHKIVPRPFGALLWQAATGLTYLSDGSDLDLLWPCGDAVPAGLLGGLRAVADAAPIRIDGEILLRDGTGFHWRELHEAPDGGSVLAKTLGGVILKPVAALRGLRSA